MISLVKAKTNQKRKRSKRVSSNHQKIKLKKDKLTAQLPGFEINCFSYHSSTYSAVMTLCLIFEYMNGFFYSRVQEVLDQQMQFLYVCIKSIMGDMNEVISFEKLLEMDFTDEQWKDCQDRISQVKIIMCSITLRMPECLPFLCFS